jgi:hypothetical protein
LVAEIFATCLVVAFIERSALGNASFFVHENRRRAMAKTFNNFIMSESCLVGEFQVKNKMKMQKVKHK